MNRIKRCWEGITTDFRGARGGLIGSATMAPIRNQFFYLLAQGGDVPMGDAAALAAVDFLRPFTICS